MIHIRTLMDPIPTLLHIVWIPYLAYKQIKQIRVYLKTYTAVTYIGQGRTRLPGFCTGDLFTQSTMLRSSLVIMLAQKYALEHEHAIVHGAGMPSGGSVFTNVYSLNFQVDSNTRCPGSNKPRWQTT